MWRKRHAPVERRIEVRIIIAVLFALSLIASMFWMGITGNRFLSSMKLVAINATWRRTCTARQLVPHRSASPAGRLKLIKMCSCMIVVPIACGSTGLLTVITLPLMFGSGSGEERL